jgi:hypothetical protein
MKSTVTTILKTGSTTPEQPFPLEKWGPECQKYARTSKIALNQKIWYCAECLLCAKVQFALQLNNETICSAMQLGLQSATKSRLAGCYFGGVNGDTWLAVCYKGYSC